MGPDASLVIIFLRNSFKAVGRDILKNLSMLDIAVPLRVKCVRNMLWHKLGPKI